MAEQDLRNFIAAQKEWSRNHAETGAIGITKHLEVISSSCDYALFDPSSTLATQFYISLHELLNSCDHHSMLLWSALPALQNVIKNKKAREVIIHTFKFIPVLTKFLINNHIQEKQGKLLRVLSELTYGVKITWQEAHLPELVETLVQILLGPESENGPLALVVLVNLCYRNLPVLYVLMRKVEITNLIKCVTKMNANPAVQMQVCKMLVILEEIKGKLPDEIIMKFVDMTFNCVTDAFQRRDSSTLRQIVDFFKDMNEQKHIRNVICRYPKLFEDTKRLVDLLEKDREAVEDDLDCMSALLEFLPSVFRMKFSKSVRLIPRLIIQVLPWVHCPNTCVQAINILVMATEALGIEQTTDVEGGILNSLAETLPSLVHLLQENQTVSMPINDRKDQLTGVATLLREMSATSNELRAIIIQSVDCEVIEKMFDTIFILEKNKTQHNNLPIQLLYLVATLATFSESWMSVYMELLSRQQVLASVALALLDGSKEIKFQVFKLIGSAGWGKDSLTTLCSIMNDLRPSIETPDTVRQEPNTAIINFSEMPMYASETRINDIIESLQGIALTDASTSAVMELYEYKLAAMAHSERRVQSALEASDSRCIGLNHQVAQLRNEVSRLHQMLLYGQQSMEGVAGEKKDLMEQLDKLATQNAQQKALHTRKIQELSIQLKDLDKTLKEQVTQFSEIEMELKKEKANASFLSSAVHERENECSTLKSRIEILTKEQDHQTTLLKAAEDSLHKAETKIGELQAQISDFRAENEEMKKSLTQCMEENSQKDEVIADYSKKIHYLEQIREAVINVAGRKEKF